MALNILLSDDASRMADNMGRNLDEYHIEIDELICVAA